MAAMRAVGNGHQLPHANVRELPNEYVVELDVSDFTESELSVEALGLTVTVRADQRDVAEDEGKAFRLHERLEENFRLPDDAAVDGTTVLFKHGTLEIHTPRTHLGVRQLPVECPSSHLINPNAEPC